MKFRHKARVKLSLVLFCILALSLFLVACGTTTTTPTATPTPTPSGTTYNGNGYTLNYPQGWKVTNPESLTTIFTSNSDPAVTFTITVTPATPLTNLNLVFTAAQTALKANANYQQDTTDLPSTSIGGDTWQETGGTYTQSAAQIKGVVLADQHPANTGSVFAITLTAPSASYDQDYSSAFQPMFQSFKFTS